MRLRRRRHRRCRATSADAEHAAKLYPLTSTRGLSLGDRACLAVAKRLDAMAVTADQAWTELDHGVEVRLIRTL
ncbi:MAG: PIN domain-containing protein [Pseudonocardiaceae bacterium]